MKDKKRIEGLFSEKLCTLHKNLSFKAREEYKHLRANLEFTLPEGEGCPIIGITSAQRGEGKSTAAVNLSYVLAEKGAKVLLVDGDLRLPSLARKMRVSNSKGLTDVLMENAVLQTACKTPVLENWTVLPSGTIPPNPSELLGSTRMERFLRKMQEEQDYILVDLPPVNVVSDVLSIAKRLTGVVVVVRAGQSKKRALKECLQRLSVSGTPILGVILTNAKTERRDANRYGYGYGYEQGEKL